MREGNVRETMKRAFCPPVLSGCYGAMCSAVNSHVKMAKVSRRVSDTSVQGSRSYHTLTETKTKMGVLKKFAPTATKKRKGEEAPRLTCARSASDRAPFLHMLRTRLEWLIWHQLPEARLFAPFAVVVAVLAP